MQQVLRQARRSEKVDVPNEFDRFLPSSEMDCPTWAIWERKLGQLSTG